VLLSAVQPKTGGTDGGPLSAVFSRCRPVVFHAAGLRVIPIPQHWRQRLLRHFNPAWLVAEQLAGVLNVPCDIHILRKSRRTRPQKRVSVTQRFDNQKQSYAIRDAAVIRGERILIVDDVLTTGATCSEVAGVLLKAGAAECHVAVIARVLDHSA